MPAPIAGSSVALPPKIPEAEMRRRLPELFELEDLRHEAQPFADVAIEAEVQVGAHALPIYSFAFGAKGPTVPTLLFVGGVHGLERIGSNILICYLRTIVELLRWDKGMQHLLERCRLLFLPMLNPGGVYARSRSNPRGIDLMRNAPLEADVKPNVLLVGGHRISPRLPWYRGEAGAPMEIEAAALSSFVRREAFSSRFTIALDLHSGFGLMDRLWFPYAYSRRPFERVDHMYALKRRLTRSLPNHNYLVEPQSLQYVTHGDLWDRLYLDHQAAIGPASPNIFLPITLEMGSWVWVKKNPRQLFSALGIFNPLLPHRVQRTLRRHLPLLDFLLRAVASHENWASADHLTSDDCLKRGMELWYEGAPLRLSP